MCYYLQLIWAFSSRNPPPGPYSQFLEEFGEFISNLITYCNNVLIFNILIFTWTRHQILSKTCLTFIHTFGVIQFMHCPTHCRENALDLILYWGIVISDLIPPSHQLHQNNFWSNMKFYQLVPIVQMSYAYASWHISLATLAADILTEDTNSETHQKASWPLIEGINPPHKPLSDLMTHIRRRNGYCQAVVLD